MNELEKIFLAFHVNGTYEYALDYVWFRTHQDDYDLMTRILDDMYEILLILG